MKCNEENPYAKLQSGEQVCPVTEESLRKILENLHPEYNYRATFYMSDEDWLSVCGCVSEGFSISFKNASRMEIDYCKKMLSVEDVQSIVMLYMRGDTTWKSSLSIGVESKHARLYVLFIILFIFGLIVYRFISDIYYGVNQ